MKKLRSGYTTGACAQAATKAAMQMLFTGEEVHCVTVRLPKGDYYSPEIEKIEIDKECVSCAVRKDAGDDPDVTNGVYVYASVSFAGKKGITLRGGPGIGTVTKPGLEQAVGEPAINKVPREMILMEVEEVLEAFESDKGIVVIISIPAGVELARRTFNPKLGIEGGISILGTTGIVNPMSEQAILDTIKADMNVRLAAKADQLIIAPGNYGLDFIRETYGICEDEVVKCSNFIGQTLDMALEKQVKHLLLVGHIGKLVKIGAGVMNTHSKWADARMETLASCCLEAGTDCETALSVLSCITTDEAIKTIGEKQLKPVMDRLIERIVYHMDRRVNAAIDVDVVLYSNEYGVLSMSEGAETFLQEWR